MEKRNTRLLFLLVNLLLLSGCSSNLLLTRSQRFETEADSLIASDRTSEALLAYHQAIEADPANHSAIMKLIPLYRQQGRWREADYLLQKLTEGEQNSLDAGVSQSQPAESASLKLLWISTPGENVPVGLAVDTDYVAVAYHSGQVTLLRLTDGQTIWSISLSETITSLPSLSSQHVFVGCESGRIFALERATGKELWSAGLPGAVYAQPSVDQTRVYVGSYGGRLAAFEIATGKMLWELDTVNAIVSPPTRADHILYFGTTAGTVFSVDRDSGETLWEKPARLSGSLEASPVVANGMLLVAGNDSRLTALDLDGKAYYWQYSTPDSIYASPLVAGNRVFVFSIGQKAAALELNTGDPLWEQELPVAVRSTPQIAHEKLYFAGVSQPYLFEMNAASGQITAKVDTGDWIESGPLLSGNILLLTGKDGAVLAYRLN